MSNQLLAAYYSVFPPLLFTVHDQKLTTYMKYCNSFVASVYYKCASSFCFLCTGIPIQSPRDMAEWWRQVTVIQYKTQFYFDCLKSDGLLFLGSHHTQTFR